MIEYKFYYSDGTSCTRLFETEKDAHWFAHTSGDHLLRYERVTK